MTQAAQTPVEHPLLYHLGTALLALLFAASLGILGWFGGSDWELVGLMTASGAVAAVVGRRRD